MVEWESIELKSADIDVHRYCYSGVWLKDYTYQFSIGGHIIKIRLRQDYQDTTPRRSLDRYVNELFQQGYPQDARKINFICRELDMQSATLFYYEGKMPEKTVSGVFFRSHRLCR